MGLIKGVKKVVNSVIGSGKADQFNPEPRLTIPTEDIQKIRDLRDKQITGVRGSTQIQLDQADRDRLANQTALDQARAGIFASLQDQAALSGGLDSGTNERLIRQQALQSGADNRGGIFNTQLQKTGLTASDIAAQEDLKNQALFQLPQIGMGIANIGLQSDAANLQARELAKANRQSNLTGLFAAGIGAAGKGSAGGGKNSIG